MKTPARRSGILSSRDVVALMPFVHAQNRQRHAGGVRVPAQVQAVPRRPDKKLARDVRKALSRAPNFNVSNVFTSRRVAVS